MGALLIILVALWSLILWGCMGVVLDDSDWLKNTPGMVQVAAGLVWGVGIWACFQITDVEDPAEPPPAP